MSDPPRSAWYIKRETRDEKKSEKLELYMKKPEIKKTEKPELYMRSRCAETKELQKF